MSKRSGSKTPRGAALLLAVAVAFGGCGLPGLEGTRINLRPERPSVLMDVDFVFESVHVTNWGDTEVCLCGWSLRGGRTRFEFPNVTLEPGDTVSVTAGVLARHEPPRYLRWRTPNMWTWPNELSDGDPVELLDARQVVVSRGRYQSPR